MALQALGGSLISKDKNGNYTGLPMTGSENISKNFDNVWGLAGNSIHSNVGTERAKETVKAIQAQLENYQDKEYNVHKQNLTLGSRNYDPFAGIEKLKELKAQEVKDLSLLRGLRDQAKEDLMNMSDGGSLGNTKKELEKSLAEKK